VLSLKKVEMPGQQSSIDELVRNYLEFEIALRGKEVILPDIFTEQPALQTSVERELPHNPELDSVIEELGDCVRCNLSEGRTNIVFGEGNPRARLMFVGEGPGADEDKQGRPFVGRAGKLLDKMIAAMTLDRSTVYIANIVKCRPPGNRDPKPDEIGACIPFLEAQIKAIEPEAIVALGRVAASVLLETKQGLGNLRGRFHYRGDLPIMPTYHPSFLLRKQGDRKWKANAWSDLKQVMALLNIPIPGIGEQT
jgi:DNA polymerase